MKKLGKIDFSKLEYKEVMVHYLKMELNPKLTFEINPRIDFKKMRNPISVEDYKFYYKNIGLKYNWLDRILMPEDELFKKINDPNTEIFLINLNNEIVGYVEIFREKECVNIQYLGLFSEFIGKGLGTYTLKWAINKAWSYSPEWVQLETCSLDHEYAMKTYIKSGFKVYRTLKEDRRVLRV